MVTCLSRGQTVGIVSGKYVPTFLGRRSAISKAIFPIRRDALSVISRVARASFPVSVFVSVSCFTYQYGNASFGFYGGTNTYQALGVFTNNHEINLWRFASDVRCLNEINWRSPTQTKRRTDDTGLMFAYKSNFLRKATMGELYPATFRDGELASDQNNVSKKQRRLPHRTKESAVAVRCKGSKVGIYFHVHWFWQRLQYLLNGIFWQCLPCSGKEIEPC